jgi:hypothetical protein
MPSGPLKKCPWVASGHLYNDQKFLPYYVACLFESLDSIAPKQLRTTANKWQKLLGELRSMVPAIPGGK